MSINTDLIKANLLFIEITKDTIYAIKTCKKKLLKIKTQ